MAANPMDYNIRRIKMAVEDAVFYITHMYMHGLDAPDVAKPILHAGVEQGLSILREGYDAVKGYGSGGGTTLHQGAHKSAEHNAYNISSQHHSGSSPY